MKRLVIDGSIAVSWFLEDELSDYGQQVRGRIPLAELVAVPAHWTLEVSNALLVAERRRRIAPASVSHALGVLRQMPISTDSSTDDQASGQTLELARRYDLSMYDAAYLELALRLGAHLASHDKALVSAAKKHGVPAA